MNTSEGFLRIVDHCHSAWWPSVDFPFLLSITRLCLAEQLRSCGDGCLLLRQPGLLDSLTYQMAQTILEIHRQQVSGTGQAAQTQTEWQGYRNGPCPRSQFIGDVNTGHRSTGCCLGNTLLDINFLSQQLHSEPWRKLLIYSYSSRMVSWVFVPVESVQEYL